MTRPRCCSGSFRTQRVGSQSPRRLCLDIDGHRNEAGGYDHDMYELQTGFILVFLSRWLTSAYYPLLPAGERMENAEQHEDVPPHVVFREGGPSAERHESLTRHAVEMGGPIFDSETGDFVMPDGSRRERGR